VAGGPRDVRQMRLAQRNSRQVLLLTSYFVPLDPVGRGMWRERDGVCEGLGFTKGSKFSAGTRPSSTCDVATDRCRMVRTFRQLEGPFCQLVLASLSCSAVAG